MEPDVVIITGSSGFIGSALINKLAGRFASVGFDRMASRSPPPAAECVCIDLTSEDAVKGAFAIYGRGENGPGLALELTGWSRDLVLCTNGPAELAEETRKKLANNRIKIREDPIARLEGNNGMLERIVFHSGDSLKPRAMFFNLGYRQHSGLAARLGCKFEPHRGDIISNRQEATNVPGIYVAGDSAFHSHMAIIAAAEGAIAALAINTELLRRDIKVRSVSPSRRGRLKTGPTSAL